jgi:lysophospholipase L1-like esterase
MYGSFSGTPPATNNDPYYYNSPLSIQTYKAAVGGTGSADLASRIAAITAWYRPEAGARNVVSIGVGTNDYTQGRSEADTYTNVVAHVAALKAVGFTVIVSTVPSAARFDTTQGDTWRTNYNALVTGGAVTYGYSVADEAANGTIGCRACYADATYFSDGTHFTSAGDAIKGSITAAILMSMGFN